MVNAKAFSLVELLVVILVMSILAAILLPTLEQGIENARRRVCLNNLHQQYIAVSLYVDDSGGRVPTPPIRWGVSSSSNSSDNKFTNGSGTETGYVAGNATGLYLLWYAGYLIRPAFMCPSSDNTGNFDGRDIDGNVAVAWSCHYGYRYNTGRAEYLAANLYPPVPPRRHVLADSGKGWRTLLTDAAGYTAYSGTGLPRPASGDPWYAAKWSHMDGGNCATHQGSARWLPNLPYALGRWPSTQDSLYYEGVDVYVR